MKSFKSVLSNTSSQIVARIISSGTSFLVIILIARAFGLSGYSDIAKITALVGLFYLGIDLGANAIFLQFEKEEQNFSQLVFFRLCCAAAIFVLVNAVVFLFPYNSLTTSGYSPLVKLGIFLFSFSFFPQAIIYSAGAFFQQSLAYHKALIASFIGSLMTLGFVVVAIIFHLPILSIIVAYLLGLVEQAGMSLVLLSGKKQLVTPSFSFFKKLFFATLPFSFLLFLNLLYFRIDMILITFFQNASAVGLYDYAYKYFDFLIALPLFLSNALYPHLLIREKYSRIQRKNIGLYSAGFFVLGLLLVPIVWFGAPFIVLVKQQFAPSIFALQILSLSLPVFFATNILQWIFITKKKQVFLVWVYATSLVLNIVLNVIFIPRYSFLASAVITDISELFVLLVFLLYLVFAL